MMSELTKCNHCSLRDMEARAAERGATVIVAVRPGDDNWISARYSDEEEPSAWFKVLTAHCVC